MELIFGVLLIALGVSLPLFYKFWHKAVIRTLASNYLKMLGLFGVIIGGIFLYFGIPESPIYYQPWNYIVILIGILSIFRGLLFLFFSDWAKTIALDHFKKFMIFGTLFLFAIGTVLLLESARDKTPFEPLVGCESNDEIQVVCGFKNPEDLVIIPDGSGLIVSEYGGQKPIQEEGVGKISLLNLKTLKKEKIDILYGSNEWGDEKCLRKDSDLIGPHGIDLVKRKDGQYQLAVVSHVPDERIEMYKLFKEDQTWNLEWKGCVSTENKYYLNDVSLTDSGSFYATHMFPRNFSMEKWILAYYFKFNTGFVIKWEKKNGFTELRYTAGAYPNGLSYDPEKNYLAVNYNLGDSTSLYDLESKQHLAIYKTNSPDNIVLQDNDYWVVSHDSNIYDYARCGLNENCTLPWSISILNRNTLDLKNKISFKNTNMGPGTVALIENERVWLGSFRSNRLGYITQ